MSTQPASTEVFAPVRYAVTVPLPAGPGIHAVHRRIPQLVAARHHIGTADIAETVLEPRDRGPLLRARRGRQRVRVGPGARLRSAAPDRGAWQITAIDDAWVYDPDPAARQRVRGALPRASRMARPGSSLSTETSAGTARAPPGFARALAAQAAGQASWTSTSRSRREHDDRIAGAGTRSGRGPGPKNEFSAVAGGAYDPSVVTGIPAWREVQLLVTRELGEPVSGARPLVPAQRSGMTWAARAQRAARSWSRSGTVTARTRRRNGVRRIFLRSGRAGIRFRPSCGTA